MPLGRGVCDEAGGVMDVGGAVIGLVPVVLPGLPVVPGVVPVAGTVPGGQLALALAATSGLTLEVAMA